MKRRWAVFLDRDGVINEEVNYLADPAQLHLLPRAAAAVRLLNRASILTIVVTNQSGVARGYLSEMRLLEIHRDLSSMLAAEDAHIDRYYYCPHHPQACLEFYRVDCECRKPKPGLIFQAARDFNLQLPACFMVGDKASDIAAGRNAGCGSVLVLTGYGEGVRRTWAEDFAPDLICDGLLEAVERILSRR